jgi:hypothetical protein
MNNKDLALSVFFSFFLFFGCNHSPNPLPAAETSFYYWKSVLDLNESDGNYFKQKNVHRIYIRFFDLDWDDQKKIFFSLQPLTIKTEIGLPEEVVPVVFITKRALEHLALKGNPETVQFVLKQCFSIPLKNKNFNEIQMDGDWLPRTRENYFNFLEEIRKEFQRNSKSGVISATIRLHQIKYRSQTGIPPVDRGILMVYHSSTPTEFDPKNSIFDEKEAKSYLASLNTYPLPLDVAFPLFQWGALFNTNQEFLKIFRINPNSPIIRKSFKHVSGTLYQAKADVYLDETRFMRGDYLKIEKSSPGTVRKLKNWILESHPNHPQRIIWFEYSYAKGNL